MKKKPIDANLEGLVLEPMTTYDNYDEDAYLSANPDVKKAVQERKIWSGWRHFKKIGVKEGRRLRYSLTMVPKFEEMKRYKIEIIKKVIKDDLEYREYPGYIDFLTEKLRKEYNIVDTNSVSSNDYDRYTLKLIDKHKDGLILDCGAGKRSVYYRNVVNFEIVPYETTDVRGVGEKLPFKDNTFDAIISMAVLEHVKDPFLCAREIGRVLKPGGELICCVPFLQPFHGYPHHYYNMTYQGLKNLFDSFLEIDKLDVYESISPIWTLTSILRKYSEGLNGKTKEKFLRMEVRDLINSAVMYTEYPFVKELPQEKKFELASATVLFAHKPS